MHKNKFFLALLFIIVVCFLYFSVKTALEVYAYSRLSCESVTSINEISVEEVKPNHFRLVVNIFLEDKGEKRAISAALGDFPNRFVAEGVAKKLKEEGKISVWYDPNDFSHVALEKKFPYKSVLSTAVLLGLSLYLLFLGRALSRGM